jgi:hypothetical protein
LAVQHNYGVVIFMDLQVTKIIEAARELLKAAGYFVDNLWHVRDVHFICEQQELPKISDDEATEVFTLANQQFDGETGLSWPQLEAALRMYLQRKMVLAAPCESNPV